MVSFNRIERRRDGTDRIAGIALTSAVPLVGAVRCWFRGPEKVSLIATSCSPMRRLWEALLAGRRLID